MGTLGGGSRIPKGGQVSGTGASVLQGDWRGAIREEGAWEKRVGEGNESKLMEEGDFQVCQVLRRG